VRLLYVWNIPSDNFISIMPTEIRININREQHFELLLCSLMSAEAAFYNNLDICKYFFRQKKMIFRLLFLLFYSGKIVRIKVGKATDGQSKFFFYLIY